jgi:hypothetical protein
MIEVDLLAELPRSVNLSMPYGTIIKKRVIYEYMLKFCSHWCMPGHTSTACQKLNTGVEDSPTSGMVKRAHVSPSGSSNEAAAVNPVISQPSGDPCPNTERVVIGSQEAVRRGKKRQSSFLSMKHLPSMNWPVML